MSQRETASNGKSAVIVGVGPPRGLGAALARRFAREGLRVIIVGRSADKLRATERDLAGLGTPVTAIVGDVTDAALVERAVGEADRSDAPLEVAIFNAGGNARRSFLDMDAAFLESMWRTGALAGFLFTSAALRRMAPRKRGSVLVTGATASLRGRAGFGGFAQAKAALRALTQSAAREFGPQGIHIAHVVIDGAIDGDRVNTAWPDLKAQRGEDGLLDPDAIAEAFWQLHAQPRTAWTHELDLRPWAESW